MAKRLWNMSSLSCYMSVGRKSSIISMEWLLYFGEIIFLSLNVSPIPIKDTNHACHEIDRNLDS